MSLNTSKTKSLLIITLQKCSTLTNLALNVQIGGRYIEQVDHAKLLGVMIDNTMCWEHHINTICCIVSCGLSLLCCIKPYLNFDSALRFYNLCVNNYLIYCSAAWGNCSHLPSYDSFVFRSVLGVYPLMPTSLWLLFLYFWNWSGSPFFISLNTGNIFFFSAFSSIWMLLIASGTDFNFFLIRVDLYTRASLYDLKVPYPRGNSGKRTLAYSATKFLNELSSDLKEFSTSSSPPTFKFLPPLLNLNYKIYFSHPYPLLST